jgi:Skp family chaperone for outer membrane proteins
MKTPLLPLFFLGVGLLALPPQAFAQAAIPPGATVAYVSGQRISNESGEGKAGQARVAALQRERAAQLQARQQTITQLRQQQAQVTDAAERNGLRLQEQEEQQGLQRAAVEAQNEIQRLQREIAAELVPRVRAILSGILKGTNVQVVLNSEPSIMWGDPALDLTNAVIERLNESALPAAAR